MNGEAPDSVGARADVRGLGEQVCRSFGPRITPSYAGIWVTA